MGREARKFRLESLETEFQKENILDGLRLRWVGWLLDQLERRDMLVPDAPKPADWSQRDVIDVREFSQWLQKYLNVSGWCTIMKHVQQHDDTGLDKPWDLSNPQDMLDAIEVTLKSEPLPMPAKEASVPVPVRGDIMSGIQEQDNALRTLRAFLATEPTERESLKVPAMAWLLAPRSAAAVVQAQATSAKALAELERARSEALLHTLRIMETDLRSSAVLAQIQDLRKRLEPYLSIYCQEHRIPLPQPGSEEEANLLFLLNAQLIALDDAQDEITRQGAELARDQIRLAQHSAKASIEARALPLQVETEVMANPMREKLLREQMRHRSAKWIARVMGAIGGSLGGFFAAAIDMITIAETIWVSGPPIFVFLLTLIAETFSYPGPLTVKKLLGFAELAFWNSLLMLGFTLIGFAIWRYLTNRHSEISDAEEEEECSRQSDPCTER